MIAKIISFPLLALVILVTTGCSVMSNSKPAHHTHAAAFPDLSMKNTATVHFGLNSNVLDSDDKAMLDTFLSDRQASAFKVVGHTCDIGSQTYNKQLAQSRANAVKQYLVDNGIPAYRIMTVSQGEAAPLRNNSSEDNRSKNRRADIILMD